MPSGPRAASSARIGAVSLRLAAKTGPKHGTVLCTWMIPKKAHARTVSGAITVTYNGVKSTKAFSARVP
jgi:hypothetical protein